MWRMARHNTVDGPPIRTATRSHDTRAGNDITRDDGQQEENLLGVNDKSLKTLRPNMHQISEAQIIRDDQAYLEGLYGDVGSVREKLLFGVLLIVTLACQNKPT